MNSDIEDILVGLGGLGFHWTENDGDSSWYAKDHYIVELDKTTGLLKLEFIDCDMRRWDTLLNRAHISQIVEYFNQQ